MDFETVKRFLLREFLNAFDGKTRFSSTGIPSQINISLFIQMGSNNELVLNSVYCGYHNIHEWHLWLEFQRRNFSTQGLKIQTIEINTAVNNGLLREFYVVEFLLNKSIDFLRLLILKRARKSPCKGKNENQVQMVENLFLRVSE